MKNMLRPGIALVVAAAAVAVAGSSTVAGQNQDDFRFRSGVELVNVTATVIRQERTLRPWTAPGRLRHL